MSQNINSNNFTAKNYIRNPNARIRRIMVNYIGCLTLGEIPHITQGAM